VLFLLGSLQALLPYLLWWIKGPNPLYAYSISYVPVIVWSLGYLAFWIGCECIGSRTQVQGNRSISIIPKRLNTAVIVALGICILQLYFYIRLLGNIPLFAFMGEGTSIWEVNDLERNSMSGQGGLLVASLFTLNGLILLMIIQRCKQPRSLSLVLLWIAILVEIWGSSFAGRRQGLFITLSFLAVGLSIYYKRPVQAAIRALGLPDSHLLRTTAVPLLAGLLILTFGIIGSVRIGESPKENEWYCADQLIKYMELPLINMEAQCAEAGVGPYQFQLYGATKWFLPSKYVESIDDEIAPFKPEPTASGGFYGELHWCFGLVGVVGFALIVGALCRFLYNRSLTSHFCLLAYCQICWTLIAAHTYNHFLRSVFIPVPVLIFLVISRICTTRLKPQLASPDPRIGSSGTT